MDNQEQEIWKDIVGFEGYYQVSNLGNVKGLDRYIKHSTGSDALLKGKYKIPRQGNHGYLYVNLCKFGKYKSYNIHQLMGIAFLGHNPKNHKIVIDHKDHNRLNNNLDNLRIVTSRKNNSYKRKNATSKYTGVYWNKRELKYHAQIWHNNKRLHLGHFDVEYDAHLAYQNKLKEITNETKTKKRR